MSIEVKLHKKESAAKYLCHKQFLYPPQQLDGYTGIEEVFNTLGAIQYDPQNPCGRSVDLSLQARVKNIHPSDYYHWLYDERRGVEAYDKELCIVPIEELPLCRKRFPPSRQRKYNTFIESNKKQLISLVEFIEENGPICADDIRDKRKVDVFWETASWAKVALDALWKSGRLVIVNRKDARKYFDIPERIYGDKFIWTYADDADLFERQVLRRVNSVDLLPASGTRQGWQGVGTAKEISPIIHELVNKGKLAEIKIEGLQESYVIRMSDFETLMAIDEIDTPKKLCFLSPLDNLLWDRETIASIFGFDYKWEAYTPSQNRKYGHYVLPILYGTKFIGRIEPKFSPAEGILRIRGMWLENSIFWDKDLSTAFWEYLDSFKEYLRTDSIKWLCDIPK